MLNVMPIQIQSFAHKIYVFSELFGYTPHKRQLEFHMSPARFKVAACGARFGKSMMAGAEGAYALLFPGKHIWYVSKSYDLADKEFDFTLEFLGRIKIKGNRRLLDICQVNNPARGPRRIETPWGSWGETKSTAKPESLLGEEIDLIIMGEASQVSQAPWDRQLYARLGPRKGGCHAISTPNWDSGFFREIFEKGQSEDWPDYESWKFSVLENPTFPKEEYYNAKRTLDDKVFAEQYDGEFTSRKGQVFPGFKEKLHVFTEMPAGSEHWLVFRTFYHEGNSFNNPFICLLISIDPKTRQLWVFKEYYRTQVLPEDVCVQVKQDCRGRRMFASVVDYWNPTLKETVQKNIGSAVTCDEKKFSRRHAFVRKIQLLQSALKEENGPQVHIHADCLCTIENFQKAKWREPKPEEMDMAEDERAPNKYIGAPIAISQALAFISLSSGHDIYRAQGKR